MGSVKKCQNYRFCDIFWDILDKMKGYLGQECVKRGLLFFQGKIGTITPDFPEEMTVFQFFPYFSTCPSLNSGIVTYTKFIFLDCAIIGPFARKGSYCYL